jgi:cobalt-zinc-cadmium efflux system protein
MGEGHSHGDGIPSAAGRHRKPLYASLALTLTYMTAEIVGGIWTGSLALIADAAHMATDAGGLALALFAIHFAQKAANSKKTYGYLRTEILAALVNAVVLLLLTIYILYEAYLRLLAPPEVLGGPMLAVAAVGLVVNLISMRLLSAGSSESLNVQGAYFEVFSDMLGSLGVIAAALIVMYTGWTLADPIIGAAIGLFIIPRTWGLLNQAVHVLMEGVPANVKLPALESDLLQIPGVISVHDLHVWTITSGVNSLTVHLVVADMMSSAAVLQAAKRVLHDKFKIDHVTIQVEDEAIRSAEPALSI